MHYVIGIDGGGTKTRGVLSDVDGNIIKDVIIGPSNYQLIGIKETQRTIGALVEELTREILKDQILYIYLGLSGADLASDFEILHRYIKPLVGDWSYCIENDTWSILRSALKQQWGLVSLYGTGSNAGAVGLDGQKHILRALGYAAGGCGGGDDLAMSALHYAFRSEEGTYSASSLEKQIPKMMNLQSMSELVSYVYPEFRIEKHLFKKLPLLVFEEAAKGDEVCIEILKRYGATQGDMVCGVLRKAQLENEHVPVVLGGSVFNGVSSYLVDAMMSKIYAVAPNAYPVKPQMAPVAGCVLYAMEHAGVRITDETYKCLQNLV